MNTSYFSDVYQFIRSHYYIYDKSLTLMKSINKLRSLVPVTPNFKCFLDFHSNPENSWTLQEDFNIFALSFIFKLLSINFKYNRKFSGDVLIFIN